MKRITKKQLRRALVKAYGLGKSAIDFGRDAKRPSVIVVTARFRDGGQPLVLRGKSLLAAALTNPRLADEFS